MSQAIRKSGVSLSTGVAELAEIERLDARLANKYGERVKVQSNLTRQLVSFQANKQQAAYRWYKYKEAFSASLVEHLIHKYDVTDGPILDPFAGMGTTLFTASSAGLDSVGIELLPIGREIIETRMLLQQTIHEKDLATLRRWKREKPWERSRLSVIVPSLRITKSAYPAETLAAMEKYVGAWQGENDRVQQVLRLALLCVLESISYTRKDGQYLRWDCRSGRRQGAKPFDKGRILLFNEAITAKLEEILIDTEQRSPQDLFAQPCPPGPIRLIPGSCLVRLPELKNDQYQAIITSPPYCNRYDYTRTYALELALLGVDEQKLVELRQQMLSCTVENRAKDLLAMNPAWSPAIDVANRQKLLQSILRYLDGLKEAGELNNLGIPAWSEAISTRWRASSRNVSAS